MSDYHYDASEFDQGAAAHNEQGGPGENELTLETLDPRGDAGGRWFECINGMHARATAVCSIERVKRMVSVGECLNRLMKKGHSFRCACELVPVSVPFGAVCLRLEKIEREAAAAGELGIAGFRMTMEQAMVWAGVEVRCGAE